MPARSAAPCWASSSCIAGATSPTTSPIPGAANGTPKAAASWSTSRRTCSTCSAGSWATIDEVSGYWANLNHPYVEVEDTAVAILRFATAASARSSPAWPEAGHLHQGAHPRLERRSVGVETDRGATFIAGLSAIAEPPLNDLWTIPGEEALLAAFQAEDRARFAAGRRHQPLPRAADPGFPPGDPSRSPAAGHRRRWPKGRGTCPGDLSIESGRPVRLAAEG